jgi:L-lactate utilization protein LutB
MTETARRFIVVSLLSAALGVLGCNSLAQGIFGPNGVASVCTDEMGNKSITLSDGVPAGCTPF